MSKTKLLLDVIEDIKTLGNSLQELVDELSKNENQCNKTEDISDTKSNKSQVSLVDVRAVLSSKSQAGFTQEVRSILNRFDANKLSEIDPKYYEEILLLAEELSNE